jgi:hypothetical protein
VEVVIHGGDYHVDQSIRMTSFDSGTASRPVTYRAADGERANLFGGAILQTEWFTPVVDTAFLDRLVEQQARSHLLQVDLSAHGIQDLGELVPHGWNLEPPDRVPPAMLTIGGERMLLARWPNPGVQSEYLDERGQSVDLRGMVSYVEVVDPGPIAGNRWWEDSSFMETGGTFRVAFDRMKHWANPEKVYLDGILGATWEWTYNRVASVDLDALTITMGRGERNGIGHKLKSSHFHFENVPEEIDIPGEYFIDRESGILYLYPPESFTSKTIVLSSLAAPVFDFAGASHVHIENLHLDTGRNLGIAIDGGSGIRIRNCTVANFTLGGIDIEGEEHLVESCHIPGAGGFGVYLRGGNLDTLEPANNRVENCRIHDFGWDQKSQIPGVFINGVGNKAVGNEIFDAPHFAIRVTRANDITVEDNEIHHLPNYHKLDGGAIYIISSGNPEQRGHVIRGNYFHHIPTNGVYIDNLTMGVLVESNVFHDVASMGATFSAVKLNSGIQNIVRDNTIIDCLRPIIMSDFALKNVFESKIDGWRQTVAEFSPVIDQVPHGKYDDFREFLTFETDDDFKYAKSYAINNLIVNIDIPLDASTIGDGVLDKIGNLQLTGNWVTSGDPGFVNYANGDFSLQPGAEAFDRIQDFNPGNIDGMGAELPWVDLLQQVGAAFPGSDFLNHDWLYEASLGFLNYQEYPWLFHLSKVGNGGMGWLFYMGGDGSSTSAYVPGVGVCWTQVPDVWPFLYRFDSHGWLYFYELGSTPDLRFFYDYLSGQVLQLNG